MVRQSDIPAARRITAKLEQQPNGCWLWTGLTDAAGYGRLGYRGKRGETLQRAVYTEFVGPIPDGHDVDHVCHSSDPGCPGGTDCAHRRCGNPAHLEAIAQDEHRARTATSRVRQTTHCPKGHPYDADNTRISGGRRFCKTCNRAAKARLRARRTEAA